MPSRDVILAAGAGQVRFPRASAQRLLQDATLLRCNGSPLEEREHMILQLIAAGHSNAEIAGQIGVSVAQARSEVSQACWPGLASPGTPTRSSAELRPA